MPRGRRTGAILKPGRPSKLRASRLRNTSYSMSDMAERTGYAYSSIAAWELGWTRPSRRVVEAYSRITGVPVEELQTRDQRKENST